MALSDGGVNRNKWGLGQVILDLLVVKLDRAGRSAGDSGVFYSLGGAALPAAVSAAAPLLVFLIALRLRYSMKTALVGAYGVGMGTITWVYAQTLFSEPALTIGWLLAIYGLVSYATARKKRWLVIAGAATGFSVLTKSTAVVALPLATLYTLACLTEQLGITRLSGSIRHARTILVALLVLAIPIAAALGTSLWYNYARYGNAFEAGYSIERDGTFGFNTPILVGLFALVLSTGKGFFFYSPTTLLGVVDARFFRAHKKEALLIWALIIATVSAHVKWWAWHGDWSWGPRFLVPLTPLFGLLSLGYIQSIWNAAPSWRRSAKVASVGGIFAVAIAVQALGLSFEPAAFLRLVSADARVFTGGFYNERTWPIRDDGVGAHFIPEFSPLAGHLWMLRIANASPATKVQLRNEPPWATLNPRWVPGSISSFNPEVQLWWAEALRAGRQSHRLAIRLLLFALLTAFLACSIWLVRKAASEVHEAALHGN